MKLSPPLRRLIAAGSLTAAALVVFLVPFNMGGCAAGNISNYNISNLVEAGKKGASAASLDEKSEDPLGQSVAVQATNRYPLVSDAKLSRYVTLVGRTVGAASAMPQPSNHAYYFGVLDTDDVNAFSGPGGYVFVTRGALKKMKDESELAGVLGHEIGHVCKHHGLDFARKAGLTDAAVTAAKSEQHVASFGDVSDKVSEGILNVGFSEPQEDEADAEGVKYVIAAGYDPNGYKNFLKRLKAEQGGGGKPFGTHPGLSDRIKKVNAQIQQAGNPGGATLADRFAANVALPG